jgi:hypothetical protein
MAERYRSLEELTEAFETAGKQLRRTKRLVAFMAIIIIVGFGSLIVFGDDFLRRVARLDGRTGSLLEQSRQVQTELKQIAVRQLTSGLQVEQSGLEKRIEKLEQDLAALKKRLDTAGNTPATETAPDGDNVSHKAVQETSPSAREEAQSNDTRPPLPKPRPRKTVQATAPAQSASTANSSPSSTSAIPKVGGVIAPGQFDLQPIPEEMEGTTPRLKGKAFFRYADQTFIVDPKDHRIIEILH